LNDEMRLCAQECAAARAVEPEGEDDEAEDPEEAELNRQLLLYAQECPFRCEGEDMVYFARASWGLERPSHCGAEGACCATA
jgi:hypothetical protein